MHEERRPPSRFTRFVRVPTPGLRAWITDAVDGEMVDISASGALVRVPRQLPLDSEWELVIDPGLSPTDVHVRVTRCEPAQTDDRADAGEATFIAGVKFIDPSRATQQAIIGLCGGTQTVEEWPYQMVLLGDNTEALEIVRRMLADGGYPVTLATDPEHGLRIAKQIHADVILASVALTEGLVQPPHPSRRIPIIGFAPRHSVTSDDLEALQLRRIPLLVVPFSEPEFLTAAKLALHQSRLFAP